MEGNSQVTTAAFRPNEIMNEDDEEEGEYYSNLAEEIKQDRQQRDSLAPITNTRVVISTANRYSARDLQPVLRSKEDIYRILVQEGKFEFTHNHYRLVLSTSIH